MCKEVQQNVFTYNDFFPGTNNGTPQPSISTMLFLASTSLAVTPSSIGTLSTIVKPSETITLGKMKLIIFKYMD